MGYIIMKGTELLGYFSSKVQVCSSLQAEASALKVAIDAVQKMEIQSCLFKTDSEILAKACLNQMPPTDVDWRAFSEVFYCWKVFKARPDYSCMHVERSQNDLADYLAKRGRIEGWSYTGFTFPLFR